MNQTQEERLNELADFLDTIPDCNYKQDYWGKKLKLTDKQLEGGIVGTPVLQCGTSACALGWSTTLWPEHFVLLVDVDEESGPSQFANVFAFDATGQHHEVSPNFLYNNGIGNELVLEFFGITKYEAQEIFGCDNETMVCTPQEKAKQIRELIAEKKA